MTIKSRITTAIATGAVLLYALAPAALAESVNVTGNGAFSDNTVKVKDNSSTDVTQSNNAKVTNDISSNASTGGNSSSFNTGGDTRIITGDATDKVNVSTDVNLNKAVVKDCGACDNSNLDLKISGNGAFSDNNVKVKNDNTISLSQDNNAKINNDINANANTGKNDSSFNTGGDSIIKTGDAKTYVDVDNKANANIAHIGGGAGSSGSSSVNITGNGAFSDNSAKISQDSAVVLDQYNKAKIYNDIDANANTGKNDSQFNTGGTTAIVTGDAKTKVGVDNMANFNIADLGCDCIIGEGLHLKIWGNGAESKNKVAVNHDNSLYTSQDNYAHLYNDVYGNSKTGNNDISFSTADVYGDPIIKTGDARSYTDVSNAGNVNSFNEGHSLHLPGYDLGVDFNLNDVLSFLHLG